MTATMLEKIVSGGQTGADQAGWRAARRYGIATGGWMPRGFLTEEGPRPEFAALYGAVETDSDKYPVRTRWNVRDSHATLWFGATGSPGFKVTRQAAFDFERVFYTVVAGDTRPSDVADWLRLNPRIRVLNVAGNRESKAPVVGERTERFLAAVFKQLGFVEV